MAIIPINLDSNDQGFEFDKVQKVLGHTRPDQAGNDKAIRVQIE